MRPVSIGISRVGTLDIVLRGDIDFSKVSEILERVRAAIGRRRPAIVRVDLAEATYLDSAGLGMLVNIMKAAQEVGAMFRVGGPRPGVHRVLHVAGLCDAFGLPAPEGGPRERG